MELQQVGGHNIQSKFYGHVNILDMMKNKSLVYKIVLKSI